MEISSCKHQSWRNSDYYYKNTMFSIGSPEILREIEEEFVFYPDDIMVCTYPKQGTTLVQEITWLIKNKVNVQAAKQSSISDRFIFLETLETTTTGILKAKEMSRPRLLKTHLPWKMIHRGVETPGVKVIQVMRNPKDTLVSYYHHVINVKDWNLGKSFPFNKFYEMFCDGHCSCGSYFDYTIEWAEQKHRKNILFLKYEDILLNKLENVRNIAEFLGEKLSSDEEERILEHTSFSEMQKNPRVNYSRSGSNAYHEGYDFIRKGEVGNWKEHFTVAQNEEFDALIEDRLGKSGLMFRYE